MKIDEVSIVFPCEAGRIPLLLRTLARYADYGVPQKVELILVTRTFDKVAIPGWDITTVKYKHEGEYFCPSLAFNLGVGATKYKNVLIGHPEVMPLNDVMKSFFESERGNYECRVYDTNEEGQLTQILYGTGYRDDWPGLYFLALYRKEDIEAINGWDMEFMKGYSNEDIDFGQRMKNAGIPIKIRDDIIGVHQYHPRGECSENNKGWKINRDIYDSNKKNKVTAAAYGLKEVLNDK